MTVSLVAAVAPTDRADAVNVSHGDTMVSANPANDTPHAMNGSVNAIVQVGTKVIAAGTFTSVSPSGTFSDPSDDLVRNRIFAFDAATGEIDRDFDPNLGGAANSLDTDGQSIYVAGSFGSVGGNAAYKRVVKLGLDGSVDTTFKAVPNKVVNEVVVRGGRVYIGGAFTSVKRSGVATSRGALAALDPTSGAVLDAVNLPFTGVYDPQVGGATTIKRFDVSADGSRLVAIGSFDTVGGQSRHQIAVLDTSGVASVAPWSTNRYDRDRNNCAGVFDSFMRDLDISPNGSFFVVSTTGAFAGGAASGTLCDTTARWEMAAGSNTQPSWVNYTGGDTTYGVAITGDVVYVGGHFRWQNNPFQGDQAGPGAVPRSGLAALDAVNGLPLSWNPGRARGVGAQALHATSQGLWIGSDTTRTANERRGRIAFMPLAGGTSVPQVAPALLPNTLFLAGGTSGGQAMFRRPVSETGAPEGAAAVVTNGVDWSSVRGAFSINGTLYHGLSNGQLVSRSFDPATGAAGAVQTVNLYDDPDNGAKTWSNIASVTGMFYDPGTHRLYYTVSGSSSLFYRYFSPESRVVGAQQFTASSSVSFANVAGMTLAGGRILYGSTDRALRSVPFSNGQVTGSPTVLSTDNTWRYAAMFVPNG